MTAKTGPSVAAGGPAGQQVIQSPSAFMRELRPEHFSDSVTRTAYQLDASTLSHHLETLTARNETHAFEIFCRKLCERTTCPNLRPATGPEGGGDSKADTETLPVADEIAALYYYGEPNAGRERWGFAFSAKKRWSRKIREDVAGLVATGRGYVKIFCVTSRFARARDRARIEDGLSRKYGVVVTILDRSWILQQVIEVDRRDLAFNYLGVGREVNDGPKLGPSDYSRAQQLADIEKAMDDPARYDGMPIQLATEALVAAKLSRNMERPRIETEGRFSRAIRLANSHGTHRQQLEAKYEHLWTGFWWFDDTDLLNAEYDAFETLSGKTDHAVDIDFLCNLAQALCNAVIHEILTPEQAQLEPRIGRLAARLDAMAGAGDRPNNALHARMLRLQVDVNRAVLARDPTRLSPVWGALLEVLEKAPGLGEFPADQLTQLIEVFGRVAGNDPTYARLVDRTAEFVASRKSEAEGALVLLKRAKQLDFDQRFEMIRLLGKAAHELTKKEYADSLIDATRLLALAYRSAGLLWAARASCVFAIASIFIEAEEDSDVPAGVVPSLMLLAWITVEMRHLPDALEAIRLTRGCVVSLPLTSESKEHAQERLQDFDMVLASQILNLGPEDLARTIQLPDVLAGLGLTHSHIALVYALGHESLLRERGAIPEDMNAAQVAELYTQLASQPAADHLVGNVIFNEPGPQTYSTRVLGIRIDVHHHASEVGIQAAEAIIASIEALFATTLDFKAMPHVEVFSVSLQETTEQMEPRFTIDADDARATVYWPTGLLPSEYNGHAGVHDLLVRLSGSIFVATCAVEDIDATIKRFFADEGVLHRISMVSVAGSSRTRVLKEGVSRLADWNALSPSSYTLEPIRPVIARRPGQRDVGDADPGSDSPPQQPNDHRELGLLSVIDVHVWDRAKWRGIGFFQIGPLPAIGLLFRDREAGRKVFERWRERFGETDQRDDIHFAIVRDVSPEYPAHYRVLVTSRPPDDTQSSSTPKMLMVASRMQTMTPESDTNLSRFLEAYARAGLYLLMPAHLKEGEPPDVFQELAIAKRQLNVKRASEVTQIDMEWIAIR